MSTSAIKEKVVNNDFIKELAKYFMLFLETDFKKRRQPKRNLSMRVNKGLISALYLDKYQTFYKEMYKNFVGGFPKEKITIASKKHVTKIPESLKELVSHRIDQLGEESAKKVISGISNSIDQARIDNQKKYDLFLEESVAGIKQQLSEIIVTPLIKDIEKPLQAAGLSTEAGLYQLEVDATEKLFNVLDGSIEGTLKNFFADNQPKEKLKDYFKDLLNNGSIAKLLKEFFKDFSTADAYSEIYQLHRNRDMLDKTELYLYFCELSIGNFSFPLFYTPITTEQNASEMTIEMDNRVFVNTKAIGFVIQEFNQQTGNRESIGNKLDRIIYVTDKKDLIVQLQEYFDTVCEMLDVETINLKETTNQSKENLVIKVNNRLQLFLFDKSDESLINDYEEIIEDQALITDTFAELINGFIADNPKRYIEEIADDWSEKSISDKLVVKSPIPLNEEQKQVMLALGKKDCNVVILEGPPGTGKSHTITAVVCQALLEGQSVLVLSDKDEALDVVQDKITETLNHVRHDKNFQNPILRLGKNSGGLSKVIEGQVLERVRVYNRAYKSEKVRLEELTSSLESKAISELGRVSEAAKQISLDGIRDLLASESRFNKYTWLYPFDVANIGKAFIQLHTSISFIENSNANYLLAYLDSADLKYIESYNDLLTEYIATKEKIGKPETSFIKNQKNLDDSNKKKLNKKLNLIIENGKSSVDSLISTELEIFQHNSQKTTIGRYNEMKIIFNVLQDITASSNSYLGEAKSNLAVMLEEIALYENSSTDVVKSFQNYIESARSIRSKLFGFSRKGQQLAELKRTIKKTIPYFDMPTPEKYLTEMQVVSDFVGFIGDKLKQYSVDDKHWTDVVKLLDISAGSVANIKNSLNILTTDQSLELLNDFKIQDMEKLKLNVEFLNNADSLIAKARKTYTINTLIGYVSEEDLLSNGKKYAPKLEKLLADYRESEKFKDHVQYINAFAIKYPDIADKLNYGANFSDINQIDESFRKMTDKELDEYVAYLELLHETDINFEEVSTDCYSDAIHDIETLTTAKMAHLLDDRIIEYVDTHAADIRTLKNMLRSKQKFPKGLFSGLKQAFPCILAGIRDYATYIPLEKDLFDLIIIDEASQVSIAQALPALIRGNKILVLGDDKQFSNVKAGNASKLTNDQMKSQMLTSLKANVEGVDKEMVNVYLSRAKDNFDIKNSVLEFCRFISNYEIMLKKHFRCYPEIIAYSNDNFYSGDLQCMKARAVPIGEVIKFDQVEHDGLEEQYRNTNTPELNFIIESIKGMKERNYNGTIGIITPHREQASLIHTTLTTSDMAEWLKERKLKVMTFDTCQGEERDYIFYSMVATETDDKHRYVFPMSLESKSDLEESRVRVQRLNVGLSRAKETIHFILSKDVDKYWGSVRSALTFYKHKLRDSVKIAVGGTDPNSKMEEKVRHYFYETKFYKNNSDSLELIPQFPLGDYLRALDKTYNHPSYKVDFLLLHGNDKIVIEYDGFKEHFIDGEGITKDNTQSYLKDEDLYRQKVLEGYGYKFIRLNKFNLGKEPVEAFDQMLSESVKKKTQARQLLTTS